MRLVTVITPFLNAPVGFFREAVESVLAQSYQRWELILVDDGSTDESSIVARKYAQDHPDRIRYLEHADHQNRGLSASRNLGIAHAKGDYVAFIDADDLWLPNKLAEQVAILDAHPEVGMVYGKTVFWHSWTGDAADRSRDYFERFGAPSDRLVGPPMLLPRILEGRVPVPRMSSALFRRDTLTAVGGLEDSFRTMYEDQVLYTKVTYHSPVYVSSVCWDKYRLHDDSMCATSVRAGEELAARRVYLDWVAGYLADQRCVDRSVWRTLAIERWAARQSFWAVKSARLRRLSRRFRDPWKL